MILLIQRDKDDEYIIKSFIFFYTLFFINNGIYKTTCICSLSYMDKNNIDSRLLNKQIKNNLHVN